LGVALVVSGNAVLAADNNSLPTVDGKANIEEEQILEIQSIAENTATSRFDQVTSNSSGNELASLQTTPIVSANTRQVIGEPTTDRVEVPEVATTLPQSTLASQKIEISVPQLAAPTADKTVAQATPEPSNTEVLDQINLYNSEDNSISIDQVTNVSQLSDVSPGDWAYEALRSLVERYGCIVGYPDGTFRGNRALTRYEFAAGLNACLNQIERLIATSTEGFVRREDLETLQRLIQEFQAELTALRGRVDNLEGRVAFLEENQFSTTTKLAGEVIFAVTDTFGSNDDTQTIFGNRVRLEFNTSFTGRDRLVTRLQAANLEAFDTGNATINAAGNTVDIPSSAEGTQTFNLFENNNAIDLDWLSYTFPFGSSKIYVAAFGGIHSDYVPTLNPYFEDFDGGNGALSTFATESPIYRIGGGAGAAISLGTGPLESVLGPSTLTLGYLAGDAADPSEDGGLFNGNYGALAQLNFNIGDRFAIGATYVHAYHNAFSPIFGLGSRGDSSAASFSDQFGNGVVGTFLANNPSGAASVASGAFGSALPVTPIVTNSYGIQAAFRLTDNISLSGFGAYTDAILIGQGGAEIWTYGAGVAFTDLGKEGNILGLFAGAQPYAGSIETALGSIPKGETPYHVEAFYKYQVTENISVTPGVIWLTAPNQGLEDVVIGTLRTTFKF
jgi:hypothetical protein